MSAPAVTEIRRLAGRVLVVGFSGTSAPLWVLEDAKSGAIAGAILFRRNIEGLDQTAALLAEIAAAFDGSPLLAVDQEGGRVARLGAPVLPLPPMRHLGELGDIEVTERAGSILGRQLRAIGFTCDFAPVLDVDTNPDNPVIGDRSFGAEVERATRHALAFGRGLQSAGLLASGKHFPGHGDTLLDSHLALPRVSHPRERLDAVELAPFRAAVGVLDSFMSAHVVFDALDEGVPATLSRKVMTAVLRDELGYGGLVFSDDLEMKAVRDTYGVGDGAVRAIDAGCDTLLICSDASLVREAQDALVRRAELDEQFLSRLQAAGDRTDAVRRRYPHAPAANPAAEVERIFVDEGRTLVDVLGP